MKCIRGQCPDLFCLRLCEPDDLIIQYKGAAPPLPVGFQILRVGARIYSRKEEAMATPKEELTKLVQEQPDDSSYDEILRELAFNLMVQRGLKDSDEGKTISNDEMGRRIQTWQK